MVARQTAVAGGRRRIIERPVSQISVTATKLFLVRTRYLDERNLEWEVRKLSQTPIAKNVSRYAVPALTLKRSGFCYENELRICAVRKSDGVTQNTSR